MSTLKCTTCNRSYNNKVWYDKHIISCCGKRTKKKINSALKMQIWDKYIGIDIGKSKCFCCNIIDITQFDFHGGHYISEYNGGETNVSNMRPICAKCNLTMSSTDMDIYMIGLSGPDCETTINPYKLEKMIESVQNRINKICDMESYNHLHEICDKYPDPSLEMKWFLVKVATGDQYTLKNTYVNIENENEKIKKTDFYKCCEYLYESL